MKHTEKAQQVLTPIHIAQRFARILAMPLLKLAMPLHELLSLEAVEQDATKSFVEVLFNACDGLIEDICICGAFSAVQ